MTSVVSSALVLFAFSPARLLRRRRHRRRRALSRASSSFDKSLPARNSRPVGGDATRRPSYARTHSRSASPACPIRSSSTGGRSSGINAIIDAEETGGRRLGAFDCPPFSPSLTAARRCNHAAPRAVILRVTSLHPVSITGLFVFDECLDVGRRRFFRPDDARLLYSAVTGPMTFLRDVTSGIAVDSASIRATLDRKCAPLPFDPRPSLGAVHQRFFASDALDASIGGRLVVIIFQTNVRCDRRDFPTRPQRR